MVKHLLPIASKGALGLPLSGVSVSADPQGFRTVCDWMQNGNVMEYTRPNPEVNRLQLVSPLGCSSWSPLLRSSMTFSSQKVMSGATYLHELGVVRGDLKGVRLGTRTYLPSHLPAE